MIFWLCPLFPLPSLYPERLATLQDLLESTRAAHVVFTHAGFPLRITDVLIREMQAHRAEVVVVDINPEDPRGAILAENGAGP